MVLFDLNGLVFLALFNGPAYKNTSQHMNFLTLSVPIALSLYQHFIYICSPTFSLEEAGYFAMGLFNNLYSLPDSV